MKITELNSPNSQQIDELRRADREQASVPDKFAEVGHAAAVKFLKSVPAKELDNYVVTMTELPKVGVNPGSDYNTPIGIYFYPGKYYLARALRGGLPFQYDAPYIQILKLTTDQILDLEKVTSASYDQAVKKLLSLDLVTRLSPGNQSKIQQFQQESARRTRVKRPGGQLWYVLWQTSNLLEEEYHKSSHVIWNWILRQLGYKVVMDPGLRIIHQNEPTQGLILDSVGTYQWVKSIKNISKRDLEFRSEVKKKFGKLDDQKRARFIQKLPLEDKFKYIEKYPQLIRFLSDPLTIATVIGRRSTASAIRYIANPSEELQERAVRASYGDAIRWIKNPSEYVQMTAVQLNGNTLKYIDNPSNTIISHAVRSNSDAIRWVDNPSEELQWLAVKEYPMIMKYIKNPTEAIKEFAIRMDAETIKYIKNPSKQLQLDAVSSADAGNVIRYIPNPDKDVQTAAVKSSAEALKFITNPDDDVIKVALQFHSDAIRYIKNPTDEHKMRAIKFHPHAIQFIENPTEQMQLAAAATGAGTIEHLLDNGIMPSQAVIDAAINTFPNFKDAIKSAIRIFKAKQKKLAAK